MLCNYPRACCCLLSLLLLAPLAQAQHFDHHPPYVDPHFNMDHSPRYHYGAQLTYSDYYDSVSCGCGSCGACTGNGIDRGDGQGMDSGRQSRRNCPPVTTASLQLWVPECCEVTINGYRTKHQTLAGVHRGSRIFTLAGLDGEPYDHNCKIEVRDGGAVYTRIFPVSVGGQYKVRYPYGFTEFSETVPIGSGQPVVNFGESSDL
jgi:hypothetical protein